MKTHRRQFVRSGLVAGSAAITNPFSFLSACNAEAGKSISRVDGRLVVLYLEGGNDGLNTVIPKHDPFYQRSRTELAIDSSRLLSLDDGIGLHPSIRRLMTVWEQGRLAIVNNVGYPGHSRSHFLSRDVWHSGQLPEQVDLASGWLGRAIDPQQRTSHAPLAYSMSGHEPPHPLRGKFLRTSSAINCSAGESNELRNLLANAESPEPLTKDRKYANDLIKDTSEMLRSESNRNAKRPQTFPATSLGQQLEQVANLIQADLNAKVFYAVQTGYDTHAFQGVPHSILLKELGDALAAFDECMHELGLSSKVTTFVFSEFGRRVHENETGGTDHGAAGPVFIMGGPCRPGIHGTKVDLEHLDNGDLKVTTDFRSVYTTLLKTTLGVDSTSVSQFELIQSLVG